MGYTVLPGYAIFEWKATGASLVREVLEFQPDIGHFNDIHSFSVTAAPSSFGRFTPAGTMWTPTLWAVDDCGGDLVTTNSIKVRVNLALLGKDAVLYRVAYTLTIKGHLATPIP